MTERRIPRYASCALATMLIGSNAARGNDVNDLARERGARVYATYCVLCHGESGHGDGRAAVLQKAPPANLAHSTVDDDYRRRIIRGGGISVARSESMPAWSAVLTDEQIEDVITYLNVLTASAVRQARVRIRKESQ